MPSLARDPRKKRTRATPSDRSLSRWPRARSPLSTGCPGPFQAQPPVQPDARQTFLPVLVPRLARGGWLRAPLPWHSPDPISLPGPAGEPRCWTDQKLTPDPGNVNRRPRRSTAERQCLTTICNDCDRCRPVQAGRRSGRRRRRRPGHGDGSGVNLPHLWLAGHGRPLVDSSCLRGLDLSRTARKNKQRLPSCAWCFRGMDHPLTSPDVRPATPRSGRPSAPPGGD